MNEIVAHGPNADQITYWNERGATWVDLQDMLDAQLRPLGEEVMTRLGDLGGRRILDIGCGCGETTLRLAQQAGASGSVVGIDISSPMLARARQRVVEAGLANVSFLNADAQTTPLPDPPFDVLFSRFGVMFFQQPAAAFQNLYGHLKSQGRLGFVCWQALTENPWMFLPFMAAAQHIPLPPPPSPDAPGPFAFADRDKVEGILRQAGFVEIGMESIRTDLNIAAGASLPQTVDFLLRMGPAAQALREANPDQLEPVRLAVRDALEPYATAAGVVMPGAAWIVTAAKA